MARGLGEREVIRLLTSIYGTRRGIPLGYDDDVSALPIARDSWLIVKTDMLVGRTDIPPGMSLKQAARKSIVATVSDFASKGVRPVALLLSLGLPRLNRTQLVELGRGLREGSEEYGCKIIGGDTGEAETLVIDCTGVGMTKPRKLMMRKGAEEGDLVGVTGKFGNSSAGLQMILEKRKVQDPVQTALRLAVFHPNARLKDGLALGRTGCVTSSIDSSDGLAWSLHELARCSGVGIRIDRLPIANETSYFASLARTSPVLLALYGGEEYEIVFTFKRGDAEKIKRAVPSVLVIGSVERGPAKVTAMADGRSFPVERRGYQHFQGRVEV